MAYLLSGTSIRRPSNFKETNATQAAQQQALNGTVSRDYFGSNKRIWTLDYQNVNSTDYATIKTIYTAYLSGPTVKTWQVTETNYTVSSVNVHIDLLERGFSVKGSDYLSDFTLILTEQ